MYGGARIVKRKLRILLSIQLVIILLLVSACEKNNSNDDMEREFNVLYLEIVKKVDYEDTQGSIKSLQSSDSKEKIAQLKAILVNLENYFEDDKKEEYEIYVKEYNGLEFLSSLNGTWDQLSVDERRRIYAEVEIIELSRKIKTKN